MRTDSDRLKGEQYLNRLARLGDLDDYEVADDDPDVRGWQVVDKNGVRVGVVDELIADRDALKIRYLSVALDPGTTATMASRPTKGTAPAGAAGVSRYRLIPIGLASLDADEDIVLLDNIDIERIGSCPSYDGGPIAREFEQRLLTSYELRPYRGESVGYTEPVSPTPRTSVPVRQAKTTTPERTAAARPSFGRVRVVETRTGEEGDTFYDRDHFDQDRFYGSRRPTLH